MRTKARPGQLPMEGKRSFLTWPEDEEEEIGFHLYFARLQRILKGEDGVISVSLQAHRGEFVACVARLGIVAGKLDLPLAPLGGFLQVSCDEAQADLSGLSIQIGHAEKVQASRALQALAPFLKSMKNEILDYETSSTDFLTASVPLLVGTTVLFGGLGAIAGPVFGFLGASTGPIISLKTAKWEAEERRHLKQQMVRAIGEMTKICSRRTHRWELVSQAQSVDRGDQK